MHPESRLHHQFHWNLQLHYNKLLYRYPYNFLQSSAVDVYAIWKYIMLHISFIYFKLEILIYIKKFTQLGQNRKVPVFCLRMTPRAVKMLQGCIGTFFTALILYACWNVKTGIWNTFCEYIRKLARKLVWKLARKLV